MPCIALVLILLLFCAFLACRAIQPPMPELTPHGTVPVMEIERLVRAARTGNTSSLTGTEKATLKAAQAAIREVDAMYPDDPAYGACLWIIDHTQYDDTHLSALEETPDSSSTPDGPLLYGKAICYGYAECYRLLLALCGIEAETVYGWNMAGSPHAWTRMEDGTYTDACWADTQNQKEEQYRKTRRQFEENGHIFP